MVSIGEIPSVVMALVVGGMILGAGALALGKFKDSLTSGETAAMAVSNTTLGIGNTAAQLPTVGTLIGVALIITVVIGAFAFGRQR